MSQIIQNENTLKLFIEQAPSAIALLDKELKYIAASNKWLEDYNIKGKNVIGVSHYEIFPEITIEWKEFHKRALNGEILKKDEDKFERIDGSFQWIKWEIRPWFNEQHEIAGLVFYTEDITEMKKNHYLVENFFNISTELFCIADFEGKFIKLNKVWTTLLGFTTEELMSKKFFDFMHEEDLPNVLDAIESLYEGNKVFNFQVRFVTKYGDYKIIKWNCIAENKQINAIGNDITEDLQNKKLIEEQQKLVDSFFNVSTELFCIANMEGFLVKINKTWETLLGYTEKELLTSKFFDFMHPEDIQPTIDSMVTTLTGKKDFQFINRYYTKNGEIKHISWNCIKDGDYINATGTDITEQIEIKNRAQDQEHQLNYFFEISNDLICILDFNGCFIRLNAEWEKSLGFSKNEMLGRQFTNFLHPNDKVDSNLEMQKLTQGLLINNFTNRYLTKDNQTKYFSWKAIPQNDLIFGIARDITVEKEYYEELEKIQFLLDETNNIAKIGYWEVDLVNEVVFWSKVTKSIHEIYDEYIPTIQEAINYIKEGYSRDLINEKFNDTINHGLSYDVEVQLITKTGKEKWARAIGKPKIENGKVISVYGTFQDINERKLLEIELENDRKRLNQIIEGTHVATWEWNVQTGWTQFNERWADIIGYTLDELSPIDINTWIKFAHPDDLNESSKQLELHFSGQVPYYECRSRMKHKDGKWVWVLDRGKVFTWTPDGKPEMMYGTHQEITTQMELQERILELNHNLTSIMDSTTQVSIIVTDLNGIITHFNKGAENLLGYTAEEMVGLQSPAIIHLPEEVEKRAIELKQKYNFDVTGFDVFIAKARAGYFDSNEWTYVRKNKTQFTVQLIVTSRKNIHGEIVGYIGVATDITKLKKYEEELIKSREKAEDANKAKSDFLANMSHEIRTPLNGVIGFTDLLMRTNLDNIQMQYMDAINKSAVSLMDLINDILDFSKIEAGKLELNIEKSDLYSLTSQAIDIIKFKAYEKQLEIILDIDYSINRFVYLDNIRLKQILINLIGNAIKFTKVGEVTLKIKKLKSYFLEENNETIHYLDVKFSIIDTGIGIDSKNFDKILQAFSQEDVSTTRKFGGTGLGLSITNKLLNLMDSHIEIKSEIGQGSEFFFIMKLKVDDTKEITEILNLDTHLKFKNVLIIDDNKNNRLVTTEILKLLNIHSVSIDNGLEAIKMIEKGNEFGNFDLLILDYHMPYLDGLEVANIIRHKLNINSQKLPILFLHSSNNDKNLLDLLQNLSVNHSILKPINLDILKNALLNIQNNLVTSVKINTIDNQSNNKTKEDNNSKVTENQTKTKVLVVEDNDVNILLAKSIFSMMIQDCELFVAENGQIALEKFDEIEPDIIFMDVQMPILNGYETTEKLRLLNDKGKNIPIIALTAGTVSGEKEKCLEAGMNDYITKPVIAQTIMQMIEKWVYNKRGITDIGKKEPKEIILNTEDNSNTTEIDLIKHFDKVRLLERVYNDEDSFNMMLEAMNDFLYNEFDNKVNQIIENHKLEDFRFLMHKLKGSSSTCCMRKLYELSRDLEEFDDFENNEFKRLIIELQSEVALIKDLIK